MEWHFGGLWPELRFPGWSLSSWRTWPRRRRSATHFVASATGQRPGRAPVPPVPVTTTVTSCPWIWCSPMRQRFGLYRNSGGDAQRSTTSIWDETFFQRQRQHKWRSSQLAHRSSKAAHFEMHCHDQKVLTLWPMLLESTWSDMTCLNTLHMWHLGTRAMFTMKALTHLTHLLYSGSCFNLQSPHIHESEIPPPYLPSSVIQFPLAVSSNSMVHGQIVSCLYQSQSANCLKPFNKGCDISPTRRWLDINQ